MQRPWKVRNSSCNESVNSRAPSMSSLNVFAHEDGDQTKPISTRLPNYTVESIHLSCESDIFRENIVRYGGIIIFSRDGESDWRTTNGKHCKSGYVVIQDSASERVRKWSGEPGAVHGAIYRSAFGESVRDHEIIGEGFSIKNGELVTVSGVFNAPPQSRYHDGKRETMSELTERCVSEVVKDWKAAGRKFPPSLGTRNFMVEDLLRRRPRATSPLPKLETLHYFLKSDEYSERYSNYGGILLFSRNGKTEWTTANGSHCKSGYFVIQETSSAEVRQWMGIEPGEVHGAIYRNAFGESIRDHAVEEAGFSVQNGEFIAVSRIFNEPNGNTGQTTMSSAVERKLRMAVKTWKIEKFAISGLRNMLQPVR